MRGGRATLAPARDPREPVVSGKNYDSALEGPMGENWDSQRRAGPSLPRVTWEGRAGPSRASGFGRGSLVPIARLPEDLPRASCFIRLLRSVPSGVARGAPSRPISRSHGKGKPSGAGSGPVCLDIQDVTSCLTLP